jgi:hypothetical protein
VKWAFAHSDIQSYQNDSVFIYKEDKSYAETCTESVRHL